MPGSGPSKTGTTAANKADGHDLDPGKLHCWRAIQGLYSPKVRREVDETMAAGGVTSSDLMAIALAAYLHNTKARKQTRETRQNSSQALKMLERIVKWSADGPGGAVRKVELPDWLAALIGAAPPAGEDDGDDLETA